MRNEKRKLSVNRKEELARLYFGETMEKRCDTVPQYGPADTALRQKLGRQNRSPTK